MPPIYRPLLSTVRLARALAPLLVLLLVVDALLPGAPAANAIAAQPPLAASPNISAATAAAATEASFRLPIDLAGSGHTGSIVEGDLNGDGALDLVLSSSGTPSQVYLNNGSGGLNESTDLVGSGRSTTDMALGDLNGDGALDLVIGNSGMPSQVYLNMNDGSGSFSGPTDLIGSGRATGSLALGDLNGDSALDLVLGNTLVLSQVFLNKNNGSGGFGAPTDLVGSGRSTADMALGDLNGDGALDLVIGNDGHSDAIGQSISESSQFLLNANDGSGSFGLPTDLTDGARAVVLGDLNSDGALDLVLGSTNYNTPPNTPAMHIYLNKNDGSGSFSPPSPLGGSATNFAFSSVALGDLNGDGTLDILLGINSAAHITSKVFVNNGSGGFDTYSELTSSGRNTTSVAVGDVNGDGALDLLLGNNGTPSQLYLNDGHVNFLTSTALPDGGFSRSVAVGDLNSDGALDIVLGRNNGGASRILLNMNNSSGGFNTPMDLAGSGRSTVDMALGDLNSDGALDIVLGNAGAIDGNNQFVGQPSQVFLNKNDGSGGFNAPVDLAGSGRNTTNVALGDLNDDGALDIVLSNVGYNSNNQFVGQPSQVFLNKNDGSGGFGAPADLAGSGRSTTSVALGDLNDDGALDLLLGNNGAASQVYLNDGRGNMSAPTDLAGSGRSTTSVALGDLNGDGALDLVLGNSTPTSQIYLNDGLGNFPTPTNLAGSRESLHDIIIGDLNGDSAPDLVLGVNNDMGHQSISSQVYLNRNNGSGAFNGPSDLQDSNGFPIQGVALGDLNNDGALDLILANGYGTSLKLINNRRVARLSNNPPTIALRRPGSTATADFYSAPTILMSSTIPISYTLSDFDGNRVTRIRASYSLDGGGTWRPARAAAGTPITNLPASRAGIPYIFTWDTFAEGPDHAQSGFFGQSDNVVFRIRAEPGGGGPFQRPYAAATTFPFRVRGTLPQVWHNGAPLAGAIVYQLPSGQVDGAKLLTNKLGQPRRTNGQGYLAGRSPIAFGDTLFALQPISSTDTYSLYFTSAAPNATGLAAPPVTATGVQTLTIAATNPLMLLNLSVALEWDARGDGAFMTRLQTDLQRTSAFLYDFTDGQVALGAIKIYQNRDHWYDQIDQYGNLLPGGKGADIRIHTTNHMRPSASQGGISVADRPDPTIAGLTYEFGHVRMGTAWNRDGEPVQKDNDDWARALAHELGHYALFLDDNYLGLDAYRRLIAVDSCPGAMSDPYRADDTEFRPRPGWLPGCAATLANTITRRADWETIKAFYDKDSLGFALRAPETFGANAGPSTLPLAVTQITVVPPAGGATLGTRFIDLLEGTTIYTPTANARVFLFSSDGQRLADLGEPANRQVSLRGAHAGDRLCLYDLSLGRSAELSRTRLGCTTVSATTSALTVGARDDWNPDVLVTLETSRTLMIEVPADGVGAPPPPKLTARLFPVDSNQAPISVDLALAGTSYSGTLQLAAPVIEGAVYVGVPNDSAPNDSAPVREMVTSYTLGGNPAPPRRPARRTRSRAPLTSSDGQVILYSDGLIFDQQTFFFYSLQTATRLPVAPQDTQIVGPGYRLIASKGASLNGVTIDMSYADSDVPLVWPDAPGFNPENGIAIYYYPRGGTYWQLLPSARDLTHNEVTTPVRGPGLYVLMSRPWQSRLGMVIR